MFSGVKTLRVKTWSLTGVLVAMGSFMGWSQTATLIPTGLPDSIVTSGTTGKQLVEVPSYCEGPAYDPISGRVFFSQQKTNQTADWPVWKYETKTANDKGMVFIEKAYQANGMEFDPQGRLVIVQNSRITRYKADGTEDSVLVLSGKDNVTFGQANDLTFLKNGALYFTDLKAQAFYLSPSRNLKVAATGLSSANGIQVIEEENSVYVHETQGGKVTRFEINTDGTLKNGTLFATTASPDGGEVDEHGNWYFANYNGGEVRVYNKSGQALGTIVVTPTTAGDVSKGKAGNVSNCTFGGTDNKTLFITGDGGLYSINLKIAGRKRVNATSTALFPELKSTKRSLTHGKSGQGLGLAFGPNSSQLRRLNGQLLNPRAPRLLQP
jgi:gluconolactonase